MPLTRPPIAGPDAEEADIRRAPGRADRALHALFATLLVLLGIGTLVIAGALVLARRTPAWWAAPDPSDAALVAHAESTERFVSNELSRVRGEGAPWRMAVSERAATAWVNARLPRWLANRGIDWPLDGTPLLVLFREGSVVLAADLARGDGGERRIVGAHLEVGMDERRLVARLDRVSIGSLGLPPALADSSIREAVGGGVEGLGGSGRARQAIDAMLRGRPIAEEAAWRMDDSRVLRLLGVDVEQGRVVLTCVTERVD